MTYRQLLEMLEKFPDSSLDFDCMFIDDSGDGFLIEIELIEDNDGIRFEAC